MSINLVKGQRIDLAKENGTSMTKVFMGLGWDVANGNDSIDLDASCVLLDKDKNVVDTVSFMQLKSKCKSVIHSGDNLTGFGDGDDEVISLDLSKIPASVENIVFTINSFNGHEFSEIDNCFARLVDKDANKQLCIYKLSEKADSTGMIMARLYRYQSKWRMGALGIPANGEVVEDLYDNIKNSY